MALSKMVPEDQTPGYEVLRQGKPDRKIEPQGDLMKKAPELPYVTGQKALQDLACHARDEQVRLQAALALYHGRKA